MRMRDCALADIATDQWARKLRGRRSRLKQRQQRLVFLPAHPLVGRLFTLLCDHGRRPKTIPSFVLILGSSCSFLSSRTHTSSFRALPLSPRLNLHQPPLIRSTTRYTMISPFSHSLPHPRYLTPAASSSLHHPRCLNLAAPLSLQLLSSAPALLILINRLSQVILFDDWPCGCGVENPSWR